MSTLFEDRIEAATKLAKEIEFYLKHEQKNVTSSNKELTVLAIPRGGIILANVIASYFECELDIIVSRKIRHELNEELAIGAVMPDGTFFMNERILKILPISQKYLEKEIEIQKKEIARRLIEFRGTTSYADKLNDRILISRRRNSNRSHNYCISSVAKEKLRLQGINCSSSGSTCNL